MPEFVARHDEDFEIEAPRRPRAARRSQPAPKKRAPGWFDPIRRRPGRAFAAILLTFAGGGIIVNDAFLQSARHPAPLFTGPAIELALASYAGFHVTAPPGKPSAYGVYTPAYIDRDAVVHTVHLPDGTTEVIA